MTREAESSRGNRHPGPGPRSGALPEGHDVTGLLKAWSGGDESALNQLIPLVQEELHQIARRCLSGERHNHSLQATALVNEAFLRLVDVQRIQWRDRVHFLAMAARLMRRVLVDVARQRQATKRGGDVVRVSFDEALVAGRSPDQDLVKLDDALQALGAFDERKSKVVELRFFGGLNVEETASVLAVSPRTVLRDWELARAWLQREMTDEARP